MSWFSILPANLTEVETWIIRFFVPPPLPLSLFPPKPNLSHFPLNQLTSPPPQLLLTALTIGPWLLFLVYDLLLYFLRTLLHEIPYIGGRAQGKRRPAKPTLEQRPDGAKRGRVLSVSFGSGSGSEVDGGGRGGPHEGGGVVEVEGGGRRREELERRRGGERVGDGGGGGGRDEAVGD